MSKIVVASFHEDENEMFERVIAALGDNVELEEFSRSPVMQFEKGLNIYPERHQVCITEKMIPLSRHEYDLLYFLARHPGWAFSKKQIFEAV